MSARIAEASVRSGPITEERIEFVDLASQYARIKDDVSRAIGEVLESRAFIQGPHVQAFERAFAAAHGVEHGIGCSSGTSALALALEALGVGRGHEVITVSHTFFACAEAICQAGARPVFVDIDEASYTIDPAAVEAAITPRTRAIMAVHLYGTPCDLGALAAIAERHALLLIEDCAQAHLAAYEGRAVGGFGHAGAFSFYPGKNLGAYGDAGLVLTRDAETADKVRRLLDHGRAEKYLHGMVGYNCRMDGLQGAILSVKLRHLSEWTAARRRNAAAYDRRLARDGFQVISPPRGADPVYHLYVVQVSNRDTVQEALRRAGIASGIHYPVPLHLQPALDFLGYRRGSLPVTEAAVDRILSLPMFPELTEEQVERVCNVFLTVARP